ncbi:MAG: hypothetical protein ACWGOV_04645 [Acidiferrobacterales bacterium]
MHNRRILMLACVAISMGLASCYQSPNATIHEPGAYKGKTDPLLEKESTPKQQEALRNRLSMASKDR